MSSEYNYSTTEHAVGIWIDGKTVYEITFFKDSNFSYDTSMQLSAIPDGFDKLIYATGYIRRANNNFDIFNWGKSDEMLQVKANSGYFTAYVKSVFSPIVEMAVTYRYTKTTNA